MKEQFLKRLRESKTESEWNDICDEVKTHNRTLPASERSGDYPTWWFPEVILSGLDSKINFPTLFC